MSDKYFKIAIPGVIAKKPWQSQWLLEAALTSPASRSILEDLPFILQLSLWQDVAVAPAIFGERQQQHGSGCCHFSVNCTNIFWRFWTTTHAGMSATATSLLCSKDQVKALAGYSAYTGIPVLVAF